jgi:Holliday junction resolvasome RuvABC DNA-binding subunit
MIGRLKGIIDEYGDDHVIIDVGGVGLSRGVFHQDAGCVAVEG